MTKVAFIGDSFCADTDEGGWPFIVAETFNADIIAEGLPGRALFHSYEILLEVVDEADYIVFCITEPHRLPNIHRLDVKVSDAFNSHSARNMLTEKVRNKLKKIASGYFTDLVSLEWHEVAQEGLLMLIDKLMLEKKKKCIWFPCFVHSMKWPAIGTAIASRRFIPKSGPCANIPLNSISAAEAYDGRENHFREENNNNMANLIIDIINNDAFNVYEIQMQDYFEILG